MKNKSLTKLQLNGIVISILLVFILSLTPLISINICTPKESEAADLAKIFDAAKNCEQGLSEDEYLRLTHLFIENTESSKVNINLIGIVGNAAGIFETAKTWITVNSIEKTMNSIMQKLESDPSYANSAEHTRNVEKLNSLNDTLGNINASLIDETSVKYFRALIFDVYAPISTENSSGRVFSAFLPAIVNTVLMLMTVVFFPITMLFGIIFKLIPITLSLSKKKAEKRKNKIFERFCVMLKGVSIVLTCAVLRSASLTVFGWLMIIVILSVIGLSVYISRTSREDRTAAEKTYLNYLQIFSLGSILIAALFSALISNADLLTFYDSGNLTAQLKNFAEAKSGEAIAFGNSALSTYNTAFNVISYLAIATALHYLFIIRGIMGMLLKGACMIPYCKENAEKDMSYAAPVFGGLLSLITAIVCLSYGIKMPAKQAISFAIAFLLITASLVATIMFKSFAKRRIEGLNDEVIYAVEGGYALPIAEENANNESETEGEPAQENAIENPTPSDDSNEISKQNIEKGPVPDEVPEIEASLIPEPEPHITPNIEDQ